MDVVDKVTRSRMMAGIGGKNTKPEIAIRTLLHSQGYRFRLHRPDLPGSPDICLPKYRIAVFVHGCFWHQHPGCRYATVPSTNRANWEEKFAATQLRDKRALRELQALGWRTLVVWECGTKKQLDSFIGYFDMWVVTNTVHACWPE